MSCLTCGQNTYSSMKLNTKIRIPTNIIFVDGDWNTYSNCPGRETYLKAWALTVQEDCLMHEHSGTYNGFFILLNTDLAPFFTSVPAYSVPFFTSVPAYSVPFFTSFPAYSVPFFTSFPAYSVPFFILDIFSLTIFTHLIIRILLSVCSNLL